MSNDEILARIYWDIGNAEEAMGPDGLVILMSAALFGRLFSKLTIVAHAPQTELFGCQVKFAPGSDLWWMVGIERSVTEDGNG